MEFAFHSVVLFRSLATSYTLRTRSIVLLRFVARVLPLLLLVDFGIGISFPLLLVRFVLARLVHLIDISLPSRLVEKSGTSFLPFRNDSRSTFTRFSSRSIRRARSRASFLATRLPDIV